MSVSNYAWLLVIGLTPTLARARLAFEQRGAGSVRAYASSFGWLSLGLVLLLSQTNLLKQCLKFVRDPRVLVGQVTMSPEEAEELKKALALGHSVGGGVIAALAQVADFGLVDPTIRQGRYWYLQYGMAEKKAFDETIRLTQTADAIFVTKFDYEGLLRIAEFAPLLEHGERLHDGKSFLLLRPRMPPSAP